MTPNVKAEAMQGVERVVPGRPGSEGTWAAVNNNASNGVEELNRPLSYSLYGTTQTSASNVQDAGYYSQQPQPSSKGPTPNPPNLIGTTPNSIEPNTSYNVDHIAPTESYSQGPQQQQQLAGYPSSAQHTLRLHHVDETQPWTPESHLAGHGQGHISHTNHQLGRVILGGSRIDGFSDGLPYGMWAPDGEAGTFSETDFMQAVWNPQPYLGAY
jgi:hypothetical protein